MLARCPLSPVPQHLLLDIVEGFITHSAVLRAQHDTEDDGSFQVPREVGNARVQCVLSTMNELHAQDDAQLLRHLQVCTFLQLRR